MRAGPAFLFVVALGAAPALSQGHERLEVVLDRSAADAALTIIDRVNAGQLPTPAEVEALVGSRPYKRLRDRENAIQRPFTDAEFLTYLRSPAVLSAALGLRTIVGRWDEAAIAAAAERARAYLPAGAGLRATIYPMIKIRPNTFVFDLKNDPSIFYALDPKEPQAKFANTLAHEMHHIGLGQNCPTAELSGPSGLTAMRGWVGAFGEGLAMLAAAGGPKVHPHAESNVEERARWDAEAAKFGAYVREQDAFFRSVIAGTAGDKEAVDKAMFAYFGEAQGQWYSVGWRMAVTIEEELGRPAVIDAFCNSHTLLATYNRAADSYESRTGRRLSKWNQRLAADLAGSAS